MPSRFTVLVPAHNEERTIGRLLAGLAPPPGREAEFEVIVLCNDCTDATAARAIEAMPQARVVQIPEPGKANAINRGLDLAHAGPVLVVDADIRVDFAALAAVAECLRDGRTMIAAPALAVDWSRASRWVRAYYRVWLTQPYVTEDLTGSGVFGLSREGIARLGRLPAIIADDAYARSRFAQAERLSVSLCAEGRDTSFTVTAPADLRSLLRIEARRRAGDAELNARYPSPFPQSRTSARSLTKSRASAGDRVIYLLVKLGGRMLFAWNRLRGRHRLWLRDESSRT